MDSASSQKSGFGFPAGAAPPDNRIQWYVGDIWKIKPFFTLNYSLRLRSRYRNNQQRHSSDSMFRARSSVRSGTGLHGEPAEYVWRWIGTSRTARQQ